MEKHEGGTGTEQVRPPSYIRWNPKQSRWAIEVNRDLLSALAEQVSSGRAQAMEVGGLLYGQFSTEEAPVLRINYCKVLGRRQGDHPEYVLTAEQQRRWNEMAQSPAGENGDEPVGYFRSGNMVDGVKLAETDSSVLSRPFRKRTHVALLLPLDPIQAASLFLSVRGQFLLGPIVEGIANDTPLYEYSLTTRRQLEAPLPVPEWMQGVDDSALQSGLTRRREISILLTVVLLLAAWIGWPWLSGFWTGPELTAASAGEMINVTWNHHARDLQRATSAVLAINDGISQQQVTLNTEDLSAGQVAYRPNSRHVEFTLIISMPNATKLNQSAEWTLAR